MVKLNPEKVKPLTEVKSEISSQLTQEAQQEYFTEFVTAYQSKWQSRTFCASGFVIERCANYKGSGHPPTAPRLLRSEPENAGHRMPGPGRTEQAGAARH